MDKDIYKQIRENEYNPEIVSKESLIKKVIKAGLITAITSTTLKKIGNAKNNDFIKSDFIKFGVASGIMMSTSQDDDTIADIGAIGAISALMGIRGITKHKVNYSNLSDFERVYDKLKKIDDIYKQFSYISVNLNSNIGDLAKNTVQQGIIGFANSQSDSKITKVYDALKNSSKFLFSSLIGSPIKSFKNNGIIGGFEDILNKLGNHSDYELYKEKFSSYDLNTLKMMAEGISFENLNIEKPDYIKITSDQYKKFIKYKNIEKNTTFTDIIGRYTTYNKTEKTIKGNFSRILEDDAHFGNALNILADNFKRDYKSQNLEINEENFIEYLNNNGFSNIIEKYYKKDNYYSYNEVSEMFTGRYDDLSQDIKEHLYYGKKSKIVESDYNNNLLNGFKNNDILGNFAFTNVIEKSGNRIIDNTALDGFNSAMNILSILEKNIIGHYKGPIGRTLNMWSPFSLIQSEARIKNNIHNNILKLTESNGIILNDGVGIGYRVSSNILDGSSKGNKKEIIKISGIGERKDIDFLKIRNIRRNAKKEKEVFTTKYYSTDTSSFKIDFKNTTKDILSDDYHVTKENAKISYTLSNIYETFKKNGIKAAFSKYTKSNFNPFGYRYDENIGFRLVNNKEGYYKEGSILNDIYGKFFKNTNNISQDDIIDENKNFQGLLKLILKYNTQDKIDDNDISAFFLQQIYKNFTKRLDDLSNDENNKSNADFFKLIFEKQLKKEKLTIEEYNKLNKLYEIEDNENLSEMFNFFNDSVQNIKKITETYQNALKNNQNYKDIFFDEFYDNINKYSIDDFYSMFKNKINEEERNKINKVLTLIKESKNAQNNAYNAIYSAIHNKYKIKNNNLEFYFNFNDIKNENNLFYSVYQEALAFENAQLYENNKEYFDNFKNVELKEIIKKLKKDRDTFKSESQGYETEDILSAILISNEKYNEIINNLKNSVNLSDEQIEKLNKKALNAQKHLYKLNEMFVSSRKKDFNNNNIKEIKKFFQGDNFFDILAGKEKDINFETYEKLNKIHDEVSSTRKEHLNIFQLKETHYNKFYVDEGNKNYISNIVYSNFEKALESKGILNSIRRFIEETIIKFSGGEILSNNSNLIKEKKIVEDNLGILFNSASSLDLASLNIFSKLQDATEIIGIERLTRKTLGNKTSDIFKNYFKYRYLPLLAITSGALAINSFSDAIIPDEVPIVGNGILGVGTRAYATARIGLQYGLKYTGMLSILRSIDNTAPGIIENGLTHFFDPLMDPSEMIDVYFYGKPIEVKKNRNWFTAGRQSAEGEEFGQYRPHLLYILGNPSSGIYSNKIEKFFRKDFLLTKYPWYILDPYKEEREAYENYGLVHPKTEQLFKDIPIFGHLMSSTIGEIIKPTQYIGEEYWKVGDNMMLNPNYDEDNPYSPRLIEFTEPNRFITSIFEGIEDLKTFSGLPGYMITKMTEFIFGATNPYHNNIVLSSLDKDTSYYRAYEKMQLGGMFGTTEGIRRLLDSGSSLGTISMNPVQQKIADWMPDYFRNGNHIYSSMDYAEYLLPGKFFDKAPENEGISKELKEFRTLSMIAPKSEEFRNRSKLLYSNLDNLSNKEREYFYESLSYAEDYGKRDYLEKFNFFNFKKNIDVTISKKISMNEFIGEDGRRYKISGITDDFNLLSKKYGSTKARKLMDTLNNQFKEGATYSFEIMENPEIAVGTDEDGDFLKIDSNLITNQLTVEKNEYRSPSKNLIGTILGSIAKNIFYGSFNGATTMEKEKIFGNRTAYQEWAFESVQSPYFRDWDSPLSSFIEPYYTMSSNSYLTALAFYRQTNDAFLNSGNSQLNILGLISTLGALTKPINSITGHVSTSSEYKKDTKIQDEIEKIKFISGEKSYYNMTGKESLKQFSKMLNEQDAIYFEGLVNTADSDEREEILKTANPRMKEILSTIWARQEAYYNNKEFTLENRNMPNKLYVTNIGAYTGNIDNTRNILKSVYGFSHNKLDIKRAAIIKSYRGGISQQEGDFISNQMYGLYNSQPYISSTISPIGNINITRRDN